MPRTTRPDQTVEYVYVIAARDGRRVKIGRSNDVRERLATFQIGSHEELVILWQTEGGAELEGTLHRHFADRKIRGEWFRFDDGDAVDLISQTVARLAPTLPPLLSAKAGNPDGTRCGEAEIRRMLISHQLQAVPASREYAGRLMAQARRDLATAARLCDVNPVAAYAAMYDGARFALKAVLANQGLRVTSKGGRIAPFTAVAAQLPPVIAAKVQFPDQIHQIRQEIEYPTFTRPEATPADVRADLPAAAGIVKICASVLDEMSPY